MKYGVFFAYWEKNWEGDYFRYVRKVHALGLDALEVSAASLRDMPDERLAALRALAEDENVTISCNLGTPREYDISAAEPAVRRAGAAFVEEILDKMTVLGSKVLIGALCTHWPYDFRDLDKPAVWRRAVAGMRELGELAAARGITLAIEVLNRFESILLNTAAEAVRFVREVDCPAVRILLDTFHMNIEENDIPTAIRTAGPYLAHFHVGERNRRLPCDAPGSLDWREIGAALREIGYEGLVIAEPFVTVGGQIARDIKVWRDLSGGADEAGLDAAARAYGRFLRDMWAPRGAANGAAR